MSEDVDLQESLGPEVEQCVLSVKEDNPDMDKESAIAICKDQLNMQDADDSCPEGHVQVGDECVEIQEVETPPSLLSDGSVLQLADLQTDPIEREEQSNNRVLYKNILALAPGVWTDSASKQTIWYSPEGIKNLSVEHGSTVNIMHDAENDVSAAGEIVDHKADESGLYLDIAIDTGDAAGEYADQNLQTALESEGAKGFGGPSVEIVEDQTEWNQARAMEELKGGTVGGLGLVKRPGSKSVHFAKQTAQRSVALSDENAQSLMIPAEEESHMSDGIEVETLLEAANVEADELDLEDRELADVPVQELVGLIAQSYDADPGELMEALEPHLDEENEGDEDIENQEDGEDEEDEGEESEEEEEDNEPEMGEAVQALDERVSALEDMMDSVMAQEDLEEVQDELADAEDVQELSEAIEEADKRLSELEEQPKEPKTLSDSASENGNDVDDRVFSRMDHRAY